MMQSLGRRYTGYANAVHERTGTLWEGRYRASVIDGEAYFLACSRYIENNPARAGLVARLADYPWSSYRANALGESDPILRPHALYQGLADGPSERQAAYRALFETALAEAELEALRVATNRGWALGGAAFRRSVEKAAGQRAGPQARGRPRRRR
jgi:putative transposase